MGDALDVNVAQFHSAMQLHGGEPINLPPKPLKALRRVCGLQRRDLWLWLRLILRDGVDLGRNGLPVSLARALAMRAQADAPDARLELGQVVTRDMHPRVQRQQLRLRLGTAVRGRRLAS